MLIDFWKNPSSGHVVVGVVLNMAQYGGTRRNMAEHGGTWQNMAKHGRTWQNMKERKILKV